MWEQKRQQRTINLKHWGSSRMILGGQSRTYLDSLYKREKAERQPGLRDWSKERDVENVADLWPGHRSKCMKCFFFFFFLWLTETNANIFFIQETIALAIFFLSPWNETQISVFLSPKKRTESVKSCLWPAILMSPTSLFFFWVFMRKWKTLRWSVRWSEAASNMENPHPSACALCLFPASSISSGFFFLNCGWSQHELAWKNPTTLYSQTHSSLTSPFGTSGERLTEAFQENLTSTLFFFHNIHLLCLS